MGPCFCWLICTNFLLLWVPVEHSTCVEAVECKYLAGWIPISMAEISIFLFHKWLSPKSTLMFAKPPWNHGFKPPHLTLGKHLKSPQTAIFLHFFLHFHGLKFHHFSTAPAKPLPGHPWVRCLIHTQTSLELVQHAVDALVGHYVGTQIHTVPGLLKMLCWRLGNHRWVIYP